MFNVEGRAHVESSNLKASENLQFFSNARGDGELSSFAWKTPETSNECRQADIITWHFFWVNSSAFGGPWVLSPWLRGGPGPCSLDMAVFLHPKQSGQYALWLTERDEPPLALFSTDTLPRITGRRLPSAHAISAKLHRIAFLLTLVESEALIGGVVELAMVTPVVCRVLVNEEGKRKVVIENPIVQC
ncbi:hypothetical protein EYF80_019860 [Liparis tanakae]|uniref:Uncharacterized protein n=1 Tax=Liparis tanakae TaxID=230148 RepID=A0A4Z2HWC0_9TELE|nr:hypothetical protein EYF80_019860 [Liparis tanakae]